MFAREASSLTVLALLVSVRRLRGAEKCQREARVANAHPEPVFLQFHHLSRNSSVG